MCFLLPRAGCASSRGRSSYIGDLSIASLPTSILICADLQGTLLPAAQRLAKRNPDSVLPSIAALLAAAKADLSAIVPDMLPLLLQMSRHARDTVR